MNKLYMHISIFVALVLLGCTTSVSDSGGGDGGGSETVATVIVDGHKISGNVKKHEDNYDYSNILVKIFDTAFVARGFEVKPTFSDTITCDSNGYFNSKISEFGLYNIIFQNNSTKEILLIKNITIDTISYSQQGTMKTASTISGLVERLDKEMHTFENIYVYICGSDISSDIDNNGVFSLENIPFGYQKILLEYHHYYDSILMDTSKQQIKSIIDTTMLIDTNSVMNLKLSF